MHNQKIVHKNIRISGRVQGVGFRYAARNIAFTLGIHGHVKNLSNGEVYIEAEGTPQQLDEFIKWCHQGPVRAQIKTIDVYDGQMNGYDNFTIR